MLVNIVLPFVTGCEALISLCSYLCVAADPPDHVVVRVMDHVKVEADNDGLPASIAIVGPSTISFMGAAKYRLPTKLLLPEAPPHDMAILSRLKISENQVMGSQFGTASEKEMGGYLFAIRGHHHADDQAMSGISHHHSKGLNPVQLGVRFGLYDKRNDRRQITVYLPYQASTSHGRGKGRGGTSMTMFVPHFDDQWHDFAVSVHGNKTLVLLDCTIAAEEYLPDLDAGLKPSNLDIEDEFYLAWSGEKSKPCPLVVSM